MDNITFKIVELVVVIVVALIARYAVPYIKLNVGNAKMEQISYWVNIFVGAAEMLFGAKTGEEKMNYVLGNMSLKLNDIGVSMSEDNLRALVEDAVYSYINSTKGEEK